MQRSDKAPDVFLQRRLKNLRKIAGLTQEQFSEISSISYKYAQSIEAGRISNPRLCTISKIARAFGISISELFSTELPSIRLQKKKPSQPHKPRTKR